MHLWLLLDPFPNDSTGCHVGGLPTPMSMSAVKLVSHRADDRSYPATLAALAYA